MTLFQIVRVESIRLLIPGSHTCTMYVYYCYSIIPGIQLRCHRVTFTAVYVLNT